MQWGQEALWVKRNGDGVIVGVEEQQSAAAQLQMNIHDQRRKEALVKTLLQAQKRAQEAHLYLTANNRHPEDIMDARLVLEHIEIALEHLGVTGE